MSEWTKDDQERVRKDASNGLPATRQETIAMLAEIERLTAEVARLKKFEEREIRAFWNEVL